MYQVDALYKHCLEITKAMLKEEPMIGPHLLDITLTKGFKEVTALICQQFQMEPEI